MGLFGNRKQDAERLSGMMGEVKRAQALAGQGAGSVQDRTGMDLKSLMGMADPGVVAEMTALRDRIATLNQRGVIMPATLRSVAVGAESPMLGGAPAEMDLTVEPPGGAPYDVHVSHPVAGPIAQSLATGQQVTVRVDSQDPQCAMLWGGARAKLRAGTAPAVAAAAPSAAPAGEDRIARLTRLQQLRADGILTEDEFAAQKAKILASDA